MLTTASYRGDAVTEVVGFDSTMLEAMLADVGATMDDLSLAVAGDEAGTVLVAAIRVDGVPGEQVVDFFVRDMEEFGFEERTVEGKRVTTTGGGGIYFYAADDVMFEILGEASLAEEAIAQLP